MKVRCIDESYASNLLYTGRIYEVSSATGNYYVLKGVAGVWDRRRFKLVPEPAAPKPLKVKCIDASKCDMLIAGNIYTVKSSIYTFYRLHAVPGDWYKSRFEVVQETDDPVTESPKGLPVGDAERKQIRMYTCFIKYFPLAMAAVAQLSKAANEQHNPGTKPHWDRDKSKEEMDSMMNHIVDIACGAEIDEADGQLHRTKIAWRAMANLERYLRNIHVQ